jgi:hypothetical protein
MPRSALPTSMPRFGKPSRTRRPDEELAAYLEQHPEGHLASLARVRIGQSDLVSSRAGVQSEAGEQAIELAFWEDVSGTDDPALLKAYLEKFPDGEFATLARARLERL